MIDKLFRILFQVVVLYSVQIAVCDVLRGKTEPELELAPEQDTYDPNYHHHMSDQEPQQTFDVNINNGYENNDPSYLIDTMGCTIPSYDLTVNDSNTEWNCGKRLVEVYKVAEKIVEFSYEVPFVGCCYSFVLVYKRKPVKTKCTTFTNKTQVQLKSDYIFVECYPYQADQGHHGDSAVYHDYYSFVTKKDLPKIKTSQKSFSVLLLGIDTMSRVRAYRSLNNTVRLLLEKGWFDMKGYQKSDSLTVNNLIPLLTGMSHEQYVQAHCAFNKKVCNRKLIWNYFAEAGYVTASGEDSHYLNSVFNTVEGPWIRPTQHYLTPLFQISETRDGHSVCSGHKQSGLELLNYIMDVSKTYRHYPLFQFYWINSFSHDRNHTPKPADSRLKNFFIKLERLGVLDDTIVILFSDHGFVKSLAVSKKAMKHPKDLFYDFSLPMLFMWLPRTFKKVLPVEYLALKLNRERISSVYDVYQTLRDILKLHDNSRHVPGPEGCETSKSLFTKISDHRTCDEACIVHRFCTCYNWDLLSNHHVLPLSNHHKLALEHPPMNRTYDRKSILPPRNDHIIIEEFPINSTHSQKQKSIVRAIEPKYGNKHVYTVATEKITRTTTQQTPQRHWYDSHTLLEKKKMLGNNVKQLLVPTTTTESEVRKIIKKYRKQLAALKTPY